MCPIRALNGPLTRTYIVFDYRWAFLSPFIYMGFIRIPVILMIRLYNKQRGHEPNQKQDWQKVEKHPSLDSVSKGQCSALMMVLNKEHPD